MQSKNYVNGGVLARNDYQAYDAEINAGVGQRTPAQKYGNNQDAVRQLYAGMERDAATGLEHTWWRKYDEWQGRWTSADPYLGSMQMGDPQTMNRYSYVGNDPVNGIDPSGLKPNDNEDAIKFYGWSTYLPLGLRYDGIGMNIGDGFGRPIGGRPVPNPVDPVDPPKSAPQQPDPKEVERLINSCLQNISVIPENYYNAIRDNKRDVQSLALSLAHAATESSFLPSIVEGPLKGAQGELGLFQIKPSTANSLGLGTFTRSQMYNPAVNTQLGTTYLQNLINSFNGDVRTALGAYKQGRGNVLNNGLSKKSQEYADGILGCERAIQTGRR